MEQVPAPPQATRGLSLPTFVDTGVGLGGTTLGRSGWERGTRHWPAIQELRRQEGLREGQAVTWAGAGAGKRAGRALQRRRQAGSKDGGEAAHGQPGHQALTSRTHNSALRRGRVNHRGKVGLRAAH